MSIVSLPFYKLSPGGNPTILVPDAALCGETAECSASRSAIARALMHSNHLGAEQVGFIDTSRAVPHMEMMGGEFCVNAVRCAAFIFARLGLPALAEQAPGIYEGTMTTSGAENPIRVRATLFQTGSNHCITRGEAAIALPLVENAPQSLVRETAPGEFLVRLPGITHVLLDSANHPIPEFPVEAAAAKRKECNLVAEEAVGVIWHFPLAGADNARAILPVVHVAATGSAVLETACGSGSLATALLLAREHGTGFFIRQPSGYDIAVSFESFSKSATPLLAWISGVVDLTGEGTAHIAL